MGHIFGKTRIVNTGGDDSTGLTLRPEETTAQFRGWGQGGEDGLAGPVFPDSGPNTGGQRTLSPVDTTQVVSGPSTGRPYQLSLNPNVVRPHRLPLHNSRQGTHQN